MKASILTVLLAGALCAQTSNMTNDDVIKLSKAGLSEPFVTDLIEKQGSRLTGDVSSLIQLKEGGASEGIVAAVARRAPSSEPLNTDSVLRLVKANFSDSFVIDLLSRRPSQFSTDAGRIIELKQAGVSERLLALMVKQSASRELPRGTEITVRMVDSIDSEMHRPGDQFSATLEDPIVLGNDVIAPKGSRAVVRLADNTESGKLTGKTSLKLQLLSVTVDGKIVPINSSDVSQQSGSRTARTAKSAAAVGVVGAIIGGIAGAARARPSAQQRAPARKFCSIPKKSKCPRKPS